MSAAPALRSIQVGAELPHDERCPGNVDIYQFVSAVQNAHRIHYDHEYTVNVQHHRALLVPGPQQTAYLIQLTQRWVGKAARAKTVVYRHLAPAFVDEPIRCFATVKAVDIVAQESTLKIWTQNAAGQLLTTGELVMRWR